MVLSRRGGAGSHGYKNWHKTGYMYPNRAVEKALESLRGADFNYSQDLDLSVETTVRGGVAQGTS